MNWNWKTSFKLNGIKAGTHILFESSILAGWYLALEGDPLFWPIGVGCAFLAHVIIFTKVDFLHQLHHHHKEKGHENHKD